MPILVLRADEHGSLVTEGTEASASENQLGQDYTTSTVNVTEEF